MKWIKFAFLAFLAIGIVSCEDDTTQPQLSDSEMADGLKEALKVGTDTAVNKLAIVNGYFSDALVKIALPDEIKNTIETFKTKQINIFGIGSISGRDIYTTGIPLLGINPLSSKEDSLVKGINRAAEAAATEVKPIFVSVITSMTINDAKNILFGNDTAATHYLRNTTSSLLFNQFEPKINTALNSVRVNGTSVAEFYEDYIVDYNSILNTSVPTGITTTATIAQLMNINPVQNTDLSAHATNKALNGLFLKVSDEEKDIRQDPLARVTDILVKVFSQLD